MISVTFYDLAIISINIVLPFLEPQYVADEVTKREERQKWNHFKEQPRRAVMFTRGLGLQLWGNPRLGHPYTTDRPFHFVKLFELVVCI